jgi:ABC-2 type transport system permease protein
MRTILKTEAKLVLREPIGIGFSLVLPLVLLLVFGAPHSARVPDPNLDGKVPIDTVMPSLALALSFGMLAVFMLPGFMADYRSRGILRRLSTTPMHPAKLLGAQLIVQAAIALASLPLVFALGAALGMDAPHDPLALAVTLALGGAALFSLGSLVAALAPDPRIGWVASATIFFPSLFLAGVWLPKEQMPDWLARAGDFTPLGGFRTSVEDAWTGNGLDPLILLALAAVAVAVSVLAARVFRWE